MTLPQESGPQAPLGGGVVRQRANYGLSFLVVLGLYASVVCALVVGEMSVPVEPQAEDCPSFCLTPAQGMMLVAIYATPYLFGLLVLTSIILVFVVRLTRWPLLAGAVSGGVGLTIAGVAVLSLVGLR